MIEGNDGGATVTFNGGRSWSSLLNQPTAQFYRVTTDDRFPYRVFGAQQDNTTVEILSRTRGRSIGPGDWHPVGGCESGWVAPKPDDPDVSFAGCYGGAIDRYDFRTGESRDVVAWPQLAIGPGAEGPEVPLPVERADPHLAPRPEDALSRGPGPPEEHGRRRDVAGDQPRPHPEREGHAGLLRRRRSRTTTRASRCTA